MNRCGVPGVAVEVCLPVAYANRKPDPYTAYAP